MSPRFPIIRFCILLIMVMAMLGVDQKPVHSAAIGPGGVITVDSFLDIDDNAPNSVCSAGHPTEGPCTLRAAIYEASQNVSSQNIFIKLPAGEYNLTIPPDYSTSNDNHSGDLNLMNGNSPTIGHQVTIEPLGSGPAVIHAKNNDRILFVASNFTVTVRAITFTGGNRVVGSKTTEGGGAIFNLGDLTLDHVSLLSNKVTCDSNPCPSTIHGGAIMNKNRLIISNSTLDGNLASRGSAIFNTSDATVGNITISYSTISNNQADSTATIMNYADLTIWNTTFSGNSLPAPNNFATSGIENYGTLRMQSTTLANKGWNSSVYNHLDLLYTPQAYFKDNIFFAESGYDNCLVDPLTIWNSEGYNIANDNTCLLWDTGDMFSEDMNLGSLGNWGGSTKTIMLNPGSPAINNHPGNCQTIFSQLLDDQRHWPRDDGQCDTGAYEYSPFFIYLPLTSK